MSCSKADPLCAVLKSGNCTCGTDIHVSTGDKITGRNLILEGTRSITLDSPTVVVTGSIEVEGGIVNTGPVTVKGDLTVTETLHVGNIIDLFGPNPIISAPASLEIDTPTLTLNVTDLRGEVTGAINLLAASIGHVTPRFDVAGQTATINVDSVVVKGTADGSIISPQLYLNAGPNVPPPTPSLFTQIGGDTVNITAHDIVLVASGTGGGIAMVAPVTINGSLTINGDNTIQSANLILSGAETVTINAPVTTINGDLVVTGTIFNPPPPPLSAQFAYITPADVDGGSTAVHPYWTNFSMWTEVNLQGLKISHQPDGGIKFEEPGHYRVDGFSTFYAEDSQAKFVSRFSNLSGTISSGGFRMGTPVTGSGISVVKGIIHVTDASLPWYYQYKTNVAHPAGLGLASGLDINMYAGLDITRV